MVRPQSIHGVISHKGISDRRDDYLYRISIKCLVRNDKGEVLVVKETGRTYWDLPGGGMDHGEDIRTAIAREMKEEANLDGTFTYKIIDVDEPVYLNNHNFWQLRLVFEVIPATFSFSAGEESDEIAFMDPGSFANSPIEAEARIHRYATLVHSSAA